MKTEICAIPICTRPTGHAIGDDDADERICSDCREVYDEEVRAIIRCVRDGEWRTRENILRETSIEPDLAGILIGHLLASKKLVANGEHHLTTSVFADVTPYY